MLRPLKLTGLAPTRGVRMSFWHAIRSSLPVIAAFVRAGGLLPTTPRSCAPRPAHRPRRLARAGNATRAALVSDVRYEMALSLEQPDTARGTSRSLHRENIGRRHPRLPRRRAVATSRSMARRRATTFNGAHLANTGSVGPRGENVVDGGLHDARSRRQARRSSSSTTTRTAPTISTRCWFRRTRTCSFPASISPISRRG